jgi:hypothetical protein
MIGNVLDIEDVASQVGIKPSSVKYYWKHDRMPPADVLFNGTPGWYQETIDAWRPKKAPTPVAVELEEDSPEEDSDFTNEIYDGYVDLEYEDEDSLDDLFPDLDIDEDEFATIDAELSAAFEGDDDEF